MERGVAATFEAVRKLARSRPANGEAAAEAAPRVPRREAAVALVAFAAAAVLLTYPVAWTLTSEPAGDGADAYLFLWNHWWFKEAILGGDNPYATSAMYHPTGTTLYLHTLSPLNAVASMALEPLVGLVGAYNALIVASFALAAWGAYLLTRALGAPRAGAAVAGLAFGFTPYHYAHALGHLNLVSYYWLPFFALFFVRHLRAPSRRTLLGSAACLVGAGLTDLSLLLNVAMFAGVLALATLGWRSRAWLTRTLAPGALAALALSPLLALVTWSYWNAPGLGGFGDEAPRYSLDVFSYALPTPFSTLYGAVGVVLTPDGTTTEATVFLGFVVIALAAVGLARGPRGTLAPWAWTGLAFFVLSLGPRLQVAGFRTPVPLPYALLAELPLLSTLRTPARFAIGVALAASVLAAFGLAHVARAVAARRPALALHRPGGRAAFALLAVLLVAELVVVPFPTTPPDLSPAYATLDESTEALVELPLHQRGYAGYLQNAKYLFAQTQHGLPIVNGYTSRETDRDQQFLKGELVLSALTRLEQGGLPPDHPDIVAGQETRAVAGDLLAARGLDTLLFHRGTAWRPTEARELAFLRSLEGVEQSAAVGDVLVFRARPTGNAPSVLVDLGGGWHGLEERDGAPFRWTFREATLFVDAREAGVATVSFRAMPFLYFPYEARHVDAFVDGEKVEDFRLPGGFSNVTLSFPVDAGANELVLRAREPAMSPLRLGVGDDPRPFGFGVADVRASLAS